MPIRPAFILTVRAARGNRNEGRSLFVTARRLDPVAIPAASLSRAIVRPGRSRIERMRVLTRAVAWGLGSEL